MIHCSKQRIFVSFKWTLKPQIAMSFNNAFRSIQTSIRASNAIRSRNQSLTFFHVCPSRSRSAHAQSLLALQRRKKEKPSLKTTNVFILIKKTKCFIKLLSVHVLQNMHPKNGPDRVCVQEWWGIIFDMSRCSLLLCLSQCARALQTHTTRRSMHLRFAFFFTWIFIVCRFISRKHCFVSMLFLQLVNRFCFCVLPVVLLFFVDHFCFTILGLIQCPYRHKTQSREVNFMM